MRPGLRLTKQGKTFCFVRVSDKDEDSQNDAVPRNKRRLSLQRSRATSMKHCIYSRSIQERVKVNFGRSNGKTSILKAGVIRIRRT